MRNSTQIGKIKLKDVLNEPGIYVIKNRVSLNLYIGQSHRLLRRLREHLYCLRKGVHPNVHLQNAWNLYGESAFRFEIIEYCSPKKLDEREQYWIDSLRSAYNCLYDEYGMKAARVEDIPVVRKEETFVRPEWHRWVYGGCRKR